MRTFRALPLTSRPSVSVVIPCYNYGHFLPIAVRSVLDQPGVDVQAVIVDDASTDGSQQVAHALAAADPRVHVTVHEQNKRHIATYNDGLAQATGDYVVLLSADDALAPGSLERSTALLEAHPEVGLVYGFAPTFEDELPDPRTSVRNWTVWSGAEWVDRVCRRGRNIIVNPEAMLRRSLMDELGGYDASLPHSADMHLWMRAAAMADVGRVNGPDQAFYRVHGSNMHLTDYAGQMVDMAEVRRAFDEFFLVEGALLPHAERLHDTARRAMAREAIRVATLVLDSGGETDRAAGFARFAIETFPAAASTFAWKQYCARQGRPLGALRRAASRQVDGLVWALRWRRWRRYGT